MNNFSLSSASVVTPQGVQAATIHISDGKIVAVVPGQTTKNDVGNCIILPGLVDPHVHINEPGRTEWEGFATATRAAASGGVTTLIDMPLNASPVTTTVAALNTKRAATEGKLWVDCGWWGGLVPGNVGDLAGLIAAGVRGIKAFLIDSGIDEFPATGEAELRQAMPIIHKYHSKLLVHAELKMLTSEETGRVTRHRYADYVASRPDEWECAAIELMIRLVREFRTSVHIVHLSSAKALPLIRAARAAGLPLTVETCPHYLFFAAEDIPDGRTDFKCAPPIRARTNREELWEALCDGTIDFIATDHSPCPLEMKQRETGDFQKAWGGIASLGLALPVVWTEAQRRNISFKKVVDWLATRPAALLGLTTIGRIAKGSTANLVVFDPDASWVVGEKDIFFRHRVSPYLGQALTGRVKRTYVHGELVFQDGALRGNPVGSML